MGIPAFTRAWVLVALLPSCARAPERESQPAATTEAAATDERPRAGGPVVLAAGAAAAWQIRELGHIPRHFQLRGWKDARTLIGRAGCNPVEVRVDVPEYVAWDVQACGDAVLAPDGRRMAWGDGRGAIRVGERGGEQRLVLDPATPSPGGEGDPTGLILWSPDGLRILTSWAAEWDSFHAVIDLASGSVTPLSTRLEGYFLTGAWDWLDADRILFAAQARRALDGRSEYSESGGYRTDLAVYDLRDHGYRKVTAVADSMHLRPLGPWGESEILVGELRRGRGLERFWVYDTEGWSRRAVLPPTPGTDALVADSTRVLIVDGRSVAAGGTRLLRWGHGAVEPLAEIAGRPVGIAWAPDGARLAIAAAVDDSAAGMPGSFVTRHVAYVIEPRSEPAEAAREIVGFLRGEVDFGRIRLADSVTLHIAPEGGRGQITLPREALRDPSRWRVRTEEGRTYSFVPAREQTQLTVREGRHLACMESALAAKFPAMAQLPHAGTTLVPPGANGCLQSWNVTFVFAPPPGPPTLVAAIYDQWEW